MNEELERKIDELAESVTELEESTKELTQLYKLLYPEEYEKVKERMEND